MDSAGSSWCWAEEITVSLYFVGLAFWDTAGMSRLNRPVSTASSIPSFTVSTLNGATAPSKFLHKLLDITWVVANIDKWSGTNYYSKLDSVARGEMGMDQLLPKVHANTFQMNALGLLRIILRPAIRLT